MCRQMPFPRYRLLFGGPLCRQMPFPRYRLLFGGPSCRQMPFPRYRLLFGGPLCRQMAVSRHRLLFWHSPCRRMLVFRHGLSFCRPPCHQMRVSRHRRRPAVMVGGYGTPRRWALCNGPPRGGRCPVTCRPWPSDPNVCFEVSSLMPLPYLKRRCCLSPTALTPNRLLGASHVSTWHVFVAEWSFSRPR